MTLRCLERKRKASNPMHFICSPFGSSGDVHPLLGLALALKQRGHQVTFVVNSYFEEIVKQYGIDFIELGTKDEILETANHPDLWNPTH
jgi:rhamnosyltransferase subunit B